MCICHTSVFTNTATIDNRTMRFKEICMYTKKPVQSQGSLGKLLSNN